VPWSNPYYRPGDNLYTDNVISWNLDSGKMNRFHQYTPGDMWDYDEARARIPIDGNAANERRKLITHPGDFDEAGRHSELKPDTLASLPAG
jgi:alcohol dehydrogenase (cytochrome c)